MDIFNFLKDPTFLVPFLSTAGASITIIILQSIHEIDVERKKKLYAVAYMTDVSVRLLRIALTLKKHTVLPHIEAVKRMIKGDANLLKNAFLADEFDILLNDPLSFNVLPDEYKVLIGYDEIELAQAFEAIIHMSKSEKVINSLNNFVKQNLKSELEFRNKSEAEQQDMLNRYWDYLEKLAHDQNRLMAFIVYIFIPKVSKYLKKKCFLLHSKKNTLSQIADAMWLHKSNQDIIPREDFFGNLDKGGIQGML